MTRLAAFILSLYCSFYVYAENVDSLKNQLTKELNSEDYANTVNALYKSSIADSEKLNLLNAAEEYLLIHTGADKLGRIYFLKGLWHHFRNRDSALYYYQKATPILEKIGDHVTLGSLYNNAALQWYDLKDTSLYLAKKSLEHRTLSKDSLQIAFADMLLGDLYDEIGIYFKSIDHYIRCIRFLKDQKHLRGLIVAYNNVAYVYGKMNQQEKEVEYCRKTVATIIELGDSTRYVPAVVHLAAALANNNKLEEGIQLIQETIELINPENTGTKAEALKELGRLVLKQKKYSEAISHLKESFKLYEAKNSYSNVMEVHLLLAESFVGLNDYRSAKMHGVLAETIGHELDDHPFLSEIYRVNAKAFYGVKEYVKAYSYLNKFMILKDSADAKENARLTREIAAQYESELSNLKIQNLQVEADLKNAELNSEKIKTKEQERLIWIIGGGLALAILAITLAIRGYIQKKRSNEIITLQKQEVEEKNKEILDSINYAKRIQNAILPPQKLVDQLLPNSFVLYKPKDIVAGDFYWLEQKEEKLFIAVADCTGHGVPGAMVSVVCVTGLNRSVREYDIKDPAQILDKTRELVIKEFEKSEDDVKDGMDIALIALQSKKENENEIGNSHSSSSFSLCFAGAHNPLYIINPNRTQWPNCCIPFTDGGGAEVKADKQPIGKFKAATNFKSHELELLPGDKIYLFSDGYADQFGGVDAKGKKFKTANLKRSLVQLYNLPMKEQKIKLEHIFETWRGEIEQIDDVCVMGIAIQ